MSDLKSCPICAGSVDEVRAIEDTLALNGQWIIDCDTCELSMTEGFIMDGACAKNARDSKAKARLRIIKRWNTRKSKKAGPERSLSDEKAEIENPHQWRSMESAPKDRIIECLHVDGEQVVPVIWSFDLEEWIEIEMRPTPYPAAALTKWRELCMATLFAETSGIGWTSVRSAVSFSELETMLVDDLPFYQDNPMLEDEDS